MFTRISRLSGQAAACLGLSHEVPEKDILVCHVQRLCDTILKCSRKPTKVLVEEV